MTKAQAKKEVCGMVCAFIGADVSSVVEASGSEYNDADLDRIYDAMQELIDELRRRAN